MPILEGVPESYADPDEVPRPMTFIGFSGVTNGMESTFHQHRKAQLLFAMRGAVTCEASQGLWIVPPQCGIWIPGGTPHNVNAVGTFEGYMAYAEPDVVPLPSRTCCAVSISPLLRELLIRCAALPLLYPLGGAESHLVTVVLDELAAAPVESLHLPMPADARVRKIAAMLMADPSDRATLQDWAGRVAVSERTLGRILLRETGMSFGRWRQQLHIVLALKWLSQGMSVQSVAADLGYQSSGSFVTMFKKALGKSPGRYFLDHKGSK
ncbi:MAG: AraC family transcriptional regulator [Pollutimonas bauzanensis]